MMRMMGVPNFGTENRRRRPLVAWEATVLGAIEDYRRRLLRRATLGRLLIVMAAAALVPLLVVVGDHVWKGGLPRGVLLAASAVWKAGLIGGLLAVVLVTLLRRLNPVFVARDLERAGEIRHNSLVNALLLHRAAAAPYAEEAVLRQAARDVATHPPARVTDAGRQRRPALVLLAALAAWLLYLIVAPKPVGPSLARFFGAGVPAPTATWLELVRPRPDEVIHAGEPLTVEVAVRGRPVDEVRFHVLDPDDAAGATGRVYLAPQTARNGVDLRRFVLPPFEVRGDIHYRCTAGDAELAGVIRVQPQPDVAGVQITLEPPAYTGWPRTTPTTWDLDVLTGTRATFQVTANADVREPVFVLRGERETRTRMQVEPASPRVATLELTLTQSGTYSVEFSDPWGRPYRDAPLHRLDVREDAAPSVDIVVPTVEQAPDDVVDVTRFPELVATAEDDVGVAELTLVVERGAGGERQAAARPERGRTRVSGRVSTNDLRIEPGGAARAWFEAADGRVLVDGRASPQLVKSRVLTLKRPGVAATQPGTPRSDAVEQPDGAEPKETNAGEPEAAAAERRENSASTEPSEGQIGQGEEPRDDGARSAAQPQSPSSQPGAEAGEEPGEKPGTRPTSHPQDDGGDEAAGRQEQEPPQDGSGEQTGSDEEFGRALRRFVQEHGKEAQEAARRAGEQREPAAGGAGEREREGGAERGARDGGQRSSSGKGAGEDRTGASQPASRPGDGTSSGQAGEKAGAGRQRGEAQPEGGKPDGNGQGQGPPPGGDRKGSGGTGQQGQKSEGNEPDGQGSGGQPGQPQQSSGGKTGGQETGQQPEQPQQPSGGKGAGPGESSAGQENKQPGGGGGAAPGGATGGAGDGQPISDDQHEPTTAESPPEPTHAGEAAPPDSTGLPETIDLLEMLARGAQITEQMLTEAGWPPEKAAAFVQALERLRDLAERSGELGDLLRQRADARVGSADRQTGRGVSGAARRDVDPAEARQDGLRRITPPREQRVPENLRAILDAYYRSLAAQRGRDER